MSVRVCESVCVCECECVCERECECVHVACTYCASITSSLPLRGIVHPERFRSNAQNTNAFARRNCPRVERNDEFACVYLCLRAFICEYCSRLTACAYVRAYVRTYVYRRFGHGITCVKYIRAYASLDRSFV